jgi:hypothetical protein
LRCRISEVGGATNQPDLHVPRRRTDANIDATNHADDATNHAMMPQTMLMPQTKLMPYQPVVVNEERSLLAHEIRFRDKNANVRRLRELSIGKRRRRKR